MARQKIHATPAARVAAHRANKDTVTVSVDLPRDLVDALNEFMRFKNLTKAQVFSKLITGQLLRKR